MKQILTTLLLLVFFASANAKTKLIIIYDDDCVNCQDLLQKTFEDQAVKDKLKGKYIYYEVERYEAKSEEGKKYMKTYNLSVVPAQIFINSDMGIDAVFMGFRDADEQLEILNNPFAKKDDVEDFLPDNFISYICTEMDLANASTDDPYQKLIETLETIIEARKMEVDNVYVFLWENIDKLVCENKDNFKLRLYNTILKYALDTANYKFFQSAIFTRVDGKKICNPLIDFTRVEIVDGEEETLIDFFDKVIKHPGSTAFHSLDAVKGIKYLIMGCVNESNNTNKN